MGFYTLSNEPFITAAVAGCSGGQGLYSSMGDYLLFFHSLLSSFSALLFPIPIEQLFTPQLTTPQRPPTRNLPQPRRSPCRRRNRNGDVPPRLGLRRDRIRGEMSRWEAAGWEYELGRSGELLLVDGSGSWDRAYVWHAGDSAGRQGGEGSDDYG